MSHIEAMRNAVEAMDKHDYEMADHILCQAIAEAEKQEPFGYLEIEDIESHSEYPHNCRSVNLWYEGGEGMVAIYTTPQPQEFVCSTGLCHFTLTQTNVGIGERGMQAYEEAKKRGWVGVSDERLMEMPQQPPAAQREWVGLTDEELEPLCKEWRIIFGSWTQDFARAIEAKLKDKNGF